MKKILPLLVIALVLVSLYPQIGLAESHDPSLYLNKNSQFDQDWIAYGPNVVAVNWGTFVISGNPQYGRHGFEHGQMISSSGPAFVGGVYQEINNVKPGATYYGFAGTASSWANSGDRSISGKIGRTVGIDPFGGTDGNSPNIVWGSELWDNAHWNFDNDPAAHPPRVWAVAKATKITFFVKIMYPSGGMPAQAWLWDDGVLLDSTKPIQQVEPPAPPTPTPIPVSAKPIRPEADYDMPNGHFYTQGSGQPGTGRGFAVTNDLGVPFYNEYQRLGGMGTLGPPISRRFMWNNYMVQAFQKVVFQWRPEAGQVYFVNIFDELSKQGKDDWLTVVRSTPKIADTGPDAGLGWDKVVERHLAMMDANPAINSVYSGDSDPINHFGLPMSYQDFGNVAVIRAQRAVLQQWKEAVPWAAAGQVTIANGGDVAKEAGILPADASAAEEPPA